MVNVQFEGGVHSFRTADKVKVEVESYDPDPRRRVEASREVFLRFSVYPAPLDAQVSLSPSAARYMAAALVGVVNKQKPYCGRWRGDTMWVIKDEDTPFRAGQIATVDSNRYSPGVVYLSLGTGKEDVGVLGAGMSFNHDEATALADMLRTAAGADPELRYHVYPVIKDESGELDVDEDNLLFSADELADATEFAHKLSTELGNGIVDAQTGERIRLRFGATVPETE